MNHQLNAEVATQKILKTQMYMSTFKVADLHSSGAVTSEIKTPKMMWNFEKQSTPK